MNQIERLHNCLLSRFPGIALEIDPPLDRERGVWHLDIQREGAAPIVVEWWPERGFGVSTLEDDSAFGVGADEVYTKFDTVLERVASLIQSGGPSVPPLSVSLAELRRAQGLTQAALAERAGVKQANISRIENRGDVHISTLARLVAALGGRLTVRAAFPGGGERELKIDCVTAGEPAQTDDLSVRD